MNTLRNLGRAMIISGMMAISPTVSQAEAPSDAMSRVLVPADTDLRTATRELKDAEWRIFPWDCHEDDSEKPRWVIDIVERVSVIDSWLRADDAPVSFPEDLSTVLAELEKIKETSRSVPQLSSALDMKVLDRAILWMRILISMREAKEEKKK